MIYLFNHKKGQKSDAKESSNGSFASILQLETLPVLAPEDNLAYTLQNASADLFLGIIKNYDYSHSSLENRYYLVDFFRISSLLQLEAELGSGILDAQYAQHKLLSENDLKITINEG